MRRTVKLGMALASIALSGVMLAAQAQTQTQFIVNVKLSAGDPARAGDIRIVAAPQFRTRAGQSATLTIGSADSGYGVTITPSSRDDGQIGVRVVVESHDAGRTGVSSFDVAASPGADAPTTPLKDASGAALTTADGHPLFLDLRVSVARQPSSRR